MLRTLAIVATAVGLIMNATIASAHSTSFATRISIGFSNPEPPLVDPDDFFSGQVRSRRNGCEPDRRVGVFRVRPGKDTLLGVTETGANGTWLLVREDPPNARYYAVVAARNIGVGGHTHICKAARSAEIKLDQPTPI